MPFITRKGIFYRASGGLSHFGRALANVGGLVSKHTNRGTEYLVSLRP